MGLFLQIKIWRYSRLRIYPVLIPWEEFLGYPKNSKILPNSVIFLVFSYFFTGMQFPAKIITIMEIAMRHCTCFQIYSISFNFSMAPLWKQHTFDFCSFGVWWFSLIQNDWYCCAKGTKRGWNHSFHNTYPIPRVPESEFRIIKKSRPKIWNLVLKELTK